MEERRYNGELRELYNDLDKRFSVLENNNHVLGEKRDAEAKEHRQYVHENFHEINNNLALLVAKLSDLPCKTREAACEIKMGNFWVHLKNLWVVQSFLVFGIMGIALRIIFDGGK